MFEIEKTMKRLNLILPIVAIIGLVSLIGHQSENYSSRVIWNVSKDLSVKYFDIKETLGNPQNFSKVVEASIIKKDQSILDLLVVDEMVVVENHAQEYTELVGLLPNIENLVHVHKNSDDSNSYVAGGIKILSVEEKDGEFVYKGLAQRTFNRVWTLTDDTEIRGVEFTDGLLVVQLGKIVPEHHSRKEYL